MEKEIRQFKEIKGNKDFTVKEIVMGLSTKIDRIEERLIKGSGKIAENRIRSVINQWILGIVFSCLGSLLFLILKLHKIW